MKNVFLRWQFSLILMLGAATSAAGCGNVDDENADPPESKPAAVETHQQELFGFPATCNVYNVVQVLAPRPGNPVALCRFDMHCLVVDANGNLGIENRTAYRPCP